MADEPATALSAEEQKYFSSKGTDSPAEKPADATPAPEPAAKPDAAPKADAEPAEPDPDNRGQFVRLGALHEERNKRKELAKSLESERQRLANMEGRFQEFMRRVEQPQAQQPPPTIDEAPVERLKYLDARMRQMDERDQQQANQHRFLSAYSNAAHEFTTKEPDFPAAYNHWQTSLVNELKAVGWNDPAAITQQVHAFEQAIVLKAFQDGVNPAERLYAVAQQRGHAKKVVAAVVETKPEDKAATAADVARVVETIQKGQAAAASLGQASGSASPKLSLETIANMDNEEFAKLDARSWRKLMGG